MNIRERAEQLHKNVDIFTLSCVDSEGYPMTKVVVPATHRESLTELFFSTNTSSKFAAEISKNSKSSVYFYRKDDIAWEGCFLKGNMEIVTDMNIKEKYWNEDYKDAYPEQSFTCPDFCLLKFIPSPSPSPSVGRFYTGLSIEDFNI